MGKQIIEINGIKMEVDLREAQTIETYKVGDHVKLLVPQYGDSFKSHSAAIIGFDAFAKQPTIIAAYLDADFGKASVKLAYINNGSKYEIVHACDGDIPFSKQQVIELLDTAIGGKQKELDEAKWHKSQFETWFGKYFAPASVESK